MEKLIKQAFLHVDTIGPHVQKGHYDLIGPDETIILPQVWETTIQPGWSISMQLWPIPEPDVSDLEVPSNSKSQALASPPSDQSKSKDKKGMLNWMTRVSRLSKGVYLYYCILKYPKTNWEKRQKEVSEQYTDSLAIPVTPESISLVRLNSPKCYSSRD